jgi:predicted nucleic acid-binding Zn ribbon protein
MHCPGCGTEAPVTQKFCRSCGFSLEKVPQLVAEQLSESEEILISAAAEKLQKKQQKIERWLSITGFGFTALMALSVLIGLIYLLFAGSLPIVPGIVLLTLVLGGSVAGLLAMYSENLKKKLSGSSSLRSRQLPEGEKPQLSFEAYDGPLISVTERTTNLLEKEVETGNQRRKKP